MLIKPIEMGYFLALFLLTAIIEQEPRVGGVLAQWIVPSPHAPACELPCLPLLCVYRVCVFLLGFLLQYNVHVCGVSKLLFACSAVDCHFIWGVFYCVM